MPDGKERLRSAGELLLYLEKAKQRLLGLHRWPGIQDIGHNASEMTVACSELEVAVALAVRLRDVYEEMLRPDTSATKG